MSNIISKVKATKVTGQDTYESEIMDIGVNSDNVAISDSNNKFSLTQLYNYLKSFFNSQIFSWYGENIPNSIRNNLIDFYQIEEQNN